MNRVLAIIKKDYKQMMSNRFIATITFVAIIAYAVIFHLMPSSVDETYEMGFYVNKGRKAIEKELAKEQSGLKVKWADSQKELRKWVENKDIQAGFAIVVSNEAKPSARLYVSSETPKEIKEAGEVIGRELANNMAGNKLPIDFEEEVVGVDRVGAQIPLRNDLSIMFLVLIMVMELFALSDLLVSEIEHKTASAVMVTPVSKFEFMSAKTIVGVSVALVEAFVLAALLNIVKLDILLPLLLILLLGAFMATSVAFIIGAVSRNAISVISWGMVAMIVLVLPSTALVLPGFASPVIKAIPTFPLVQMLDGVVNRGLMITDFGPQLMYLTLISAAFFAIGFVFFRRRLV